VFSARCARESHDQHATPFLQGIGRFVISGFHMQSFLVVLSMAQNPGCYAARLLATKPFVILGDLSFASYMIHIQVSCALVSSFAVVFLAFTFDDLSFASYMIHIQVSCALVSSCFLFAFAFAFNVSFVENTA
jgi:peptidoglycan/LPS O-acetylase OafA/YrhL